MTVNSSINEYKEAVENLASNQSNFKFSNASPLHAAIAISTMLKFAKHRFIIYDYDFTGDLVDLNSDFFKNFQEFINKGMILEIVVDDFSNIGNSSIYRIIAKYSLDFPGKAKVFVASEVFKSTIRKLYDKDIHFAIADNRSYRIEEAINNDIRDRKAICCFNDHKVCSKIISAFYSTLDTCNTITL